MALLATGLVQAVQAAGPAPVGLPGSVKTVVEAVQTGPNDPRHPYISRKTLRQGESAAVLEFEVTLKMRNFSELQARVAKGARFSPQEMAAKYDPTAVDYQTVLDWLTRQGFKITRQDPNRLAIFASGSVSRIGQVMQVTFARVMSEGNEYTSAISAPVVPADVSSLLVGINGLQPHLRMHKHIVLKPNGLNGSQYPPYIPSDLLAAYSANRYNFNYNGTGQSIAIAIDTFPSTSDLTYFWSSCGVTQSLSNISFIQVVAGTLPAPSGEETLDTEWASSIAPGSKVRVYAATSLLSSNLDQVYQQVYTDATTHPEYGIHQLSMSYGLGETYTTLSQVQTDAQYFAELASAGVTPFASSGDGGSTPDNMKGNTGPTQVETPASDANVTGVGGTTLYLNYNGNGLTENGWSGSGGGTSIYVSRPAWQQGTGVSAGSYRVVPDVALAADPSTPALISFNGSLSSASGTSWGAPTWAGFSAILNQIRVTSGLAPLGSLGSKIYPLLGSDNFRDITSGSNGYNAGAGYDLVTGIGVPNVATLAQTLGPSPMTVLHTFGDGTISHDGQSPSAPLIMGQDGNFYGTTSKGGTAGMGTVFQMTPQGAVTILHNFGDGSVTNDGSDPRGLIQGSDGNFYGVTYAGGTPGTGGTTYGTIFKMTPQKVVTILHDFGNSSVTQDGQNPVGSMIQATDGNFYGVTQNGGANNSNGIIFKISAQGTYALLHSFNYNANEGAGPIGLVQATDGNFYGTTYYNVFKMTPLGALTILHVFGDGTVANDGTAILAPLIQGTDGNFYGTASRGGIDTAGNVFKITPLGVETILHQFGDGSVPNDGSTPQIALLQGADGNFYGITYWNAFNGSQIFKMTPTGTETILHNFGEGSVTTYDGDFISPDVVQANSLIQAPDGTLYGTVADAGSTERGTVYKMGLLSALSFSSPASAIFTAGYAGSFTVSATGSSSLVYSATGLPSWATLDSSTGVLSGTPPDTSGAPYTVTLTAGNGGTLPSISQTFTLNVQTAAAPQITNGPPPSTPSVDYGYTFTYQATGFPAPTFALASGSLPPGLTLASNGVLSGYPTTPGLYTGSISASNGVGSAAVQNFSIEVEQMVKITSSPLNTTIQAGNPFNFTFQALGYPPPTFTGFGGPYGLTLSANGVISGTPGVGSGGVYTGTVYASNNYGTYGSGDSQAYALTILEPPGFHEGYQPGPTLLNTSYYYSFYSYSTGYPAATFSLTSGSFPPGLTMSGGVLTGTTTQVGTFSGVVTASNGVSPAATQSFTISVQAPSAPVISSGLPPQGTTGSPYSFTFQSNTLPSPTFSITSGSLPPGIFELTGFSFFGPPTWSGTLIGTPTQAGSYTFTVDASNGINPDASQTFTINVVDPTMDTPTLPPWGCGVMALLLLLISARFLKKVHT